MIMQPSLVPPHLETLEPVKLESRKKWIGIGLGSLLVICCIFSMLTLAWAITFTSLYVTRCDSNSLSPIVFSSATQCSTVSCPSGLSCTSCPTSRSDDTSGIDTFSVLHHCTTGNAQSCCNELATYVQSGQTPLPNISEIFCFDRSACNSASSCVASVVVPQLTATANLEIVNETPKRPGGATLYDNPDGAYLSLSIFGQDFCTFSSGGCKVSAQGRFSVYAPTPGIQTFGIQWNLNRIASSDGTTCDNACEQFHLTPSTCTITKLSGSATYCSTVPTPTWTAALVPVLANGVCTITVGSTSVLDSPTADKCSCKYGPPCSCPGAACAGRCPYDKGACGTPTAGQCSVCN